MKRLLKAIEIRPRHSATRPSHHSPRSFGVVVGGRVGRALAVVGHLPKRPKRIHHR
ncbi:hypothetical protein [Ilumatobacter sp.]|uniref:hypothetical protein n=1 Tax=Ilumatobacter sp. TaxID=1967498 RepID=UPI003AF52312